MSINDTVEKVKRKLPVWNVIRVNSNTKAVEPFNIFQNIPFCIGFFELCDGMDRSEFEEELDLLIKWQFWARCQYEHLVLPWPTHESDQSTKIDVYTQLKFNWNAFSDFCWRVYRVKGRK